VNSWKSGNGNIIRNFFESKIRKNERNSLHNNNYDVDLNNIIVSLFIELFEKFELYYYDDFVESSQRRKILELLFLVRISLFNFFYGEKCPSYFNAIYHGIEKIKKNYGNVKDKSIFDKYEKNLKETKNYTKLQPICSAENKLNEFPSSKNSNSSSIFSYGILERIVENSNYDNMMKMSFSTNIEVVEYIQFLLNHPNIQSIFFPCFKPSRILLDSFNVFIFEKRCTDFYFHDACIEILSDFSFKDDNHMKLLDDFGDAYEGECKNYTLHGKGILIKKNGVTLEGEFKDGLLHGKGKYFDPTGESYLGDFKKGRMNGRGVCFYKNGEIYSGEFHEGIKNGRGIFFYKSGLICSGEFKDGLINEKIISFHLDKSVSFRKFNEGLFKGKVITINQNSEISSVCLNKANQLNSTYIFRPIGLVEKSIVQKNLEISVDLKNLFNEKNVVLKLINDFLHTY
jgi:hypothetical protein